MESTQEYDHFGRFGDIVLFALMAVIGCAPWRTFGCTTVVDRKKESHVFKQIVGIFVRLFLIMLH